MDELMIFVAVFSSSKIEALIQNNPTEIFKRDKIQRNETFLQGSVKFK